MTLFERVSVTPLLQIRFLMEANMAKATVGLFENTDLVDEFVHDLDASSFPRKDIRVLSEPREMASSGMMSTPH